MRVVQINCPIDRHGHDPDALLAAWPTLPAVARATAGACVDVTVVQASSYDAEIMRDRVTYRFVREPQLWTRSVAGNAPWRLAAAAREAAPDLIHFHGFDFPFHARAACSIGVPVLVQDHASRDRAARTRLRRWGYRRIAAVAFTAPDQAQPFLDAGILPPSIPLFAIPESSTHFAPGDRAAARRESGIHGDPALLWVGHLDANKDPLTILRAFQAALPQLPHAELWLAFGSAPLLDQIHALLARAPELAARVHLLGQLPHARLEACYRAADCFVLGSHSEGSGYALTEALACGLPPLVSDIPSFRALVADTGIGRLAPPGDSQAFAAELVALAAARPLAASVRAHFDRQLSFAQVGKRLAQAYAAVLERAGRR